MIDQEVALEALSVICNAEVTSIQRQRSDVGLLTAGGAAQPLLSIKQFMLTVLDGDENCLVSRLNSVRAPFECGLPRFAPPMTSNLNVHQDSSGTLHIIDEDEFLDPGYNYDFTHLKDTETYYRGDEVYQRPCGWCRFALKVLDKYDENTWLGTRYRSTKSEPGEWPVSYHGTSQKGAEGIISGYLKPGKGKVHGRGVYSTPYISEALPYAKKFTSKKTGKTYEVILQNRINPKYREKHNDDKYWLVHIPKGTSEKKEQEMVNRAIRPYGLLLREVK